MPGSLQAQGWMPVAGRLVPASPETLEQAEFRQFLPQLYGHLGDALAALAEIERRFRLLQVAPALEGAARLPVGPDHHGFEHEMAARNALVVDKGPDFEQ